ncbi:MAG: hypothetical protein ABI878_09485 [Acidobacteriota bacterium]
MSNQTNLAFSVLASDWEVSTICQIGGANIIGAGVWFVKFRSKWASVDEPFNFSGGLFGYGGSIGGATAPNFRTPGQLSYSKIKCQRSFSINDLDGTLGRITNFSASVMVGYSIVLVSAYNLSGSLFYSQWANGWGTGFGAMGVTGVGTWTHMNPAAAAAQAQAVTGVRVGGSE